MSVTVTTKKDFPKRIKTEKLPLDSKVLQPPIQENLLPPLTGNEENNSIEENYNDDGTVGKIKIKYSGEEHTLDVFADEFIDKDDIAQFRRKQKQNVI